MAKRAPLLLLLIAAVALVYGRAAGFGFISWDDPTHIAQNALFHPVSLSSTLQFWKAPFFSLYIPLTYTAWAAWGSVFGFGPGALHALNVLMHCLNSALVFFLLQRLLNDRKGHASLAGALVFALHPLQAEAVAWISCFKDLLATGLGLGALLLSFRPGRRSLALSLALYALALLAKPATVCLPIIAAAIRRLWLKRSWRECGALLGIGTFVALPILWITKLAQPNSRMVEIPSVPARVLVALDSLRFYIDKLLWPHPLALDYGHTAAQALSPANVALSIALALALGLGLRLAWRHAHGALLVTTLALFIAALLPTLGLVPFEFQNFSDVADHYAYLALLGPALLVAGLAEPLSPRSLGALLLLPALYGGVSFAALGSWRNEKSSCEHILEVNPASFGTYQSLGNYELERGNFDRALELYRKSLEANPRYVIVQQNIGVALIRAGRFGDAATHYSRAIADLEKAKLDDPKLLAEMHSNYAIALGSTGRTDAALAQLGTALRLNPDLFEAHKALGILYSQLGREAESRASFERAEQLRPGDPSVRQALGL